MAPASGFDEEDADAGEGLVPALFWGICDAKYDPRRPQGERLKVLELGDGRSSRFSGHGAAARDKFRSEYCLAWNYLRLDVLVENKQLTHDRFLQEGFAHLRPAAACYPRRYTEDLAARVLKDLGVGDGEVVLKLCNRNRGAGVVVVPAGKLDGVLRQLLLPPCGAEMEAWLEQREDDALQQEHSGDFQEQCLHWWSNEYPGFIAEACCRSLPVAAADKPGQVFDGTLRVAFALRRPEQEDLPSERGLEVNWLGGYWKLPRAAAAAAIPRGGGGDAGAGAATPREVSLEEARARVVSSFSSGEKRTADVEKAHLEEVYSVLAPALLRVLRIGGAIDAMSLMHGYRATPAVCAFLLARAAAAMRRDKMRNAKNLLDLAKGLVPAPKAPTAGNMPERSALSYIERNLAVCCLMEQHQQLTGRGRLTLLDAVAKVDSSLRWLPTSASAHYIKGRCHHDAGEFEPGARCLLKAVALDPDFKQPYLALGNCLLQLGRFRAAAEASRACLSRHSDSPTAHFNLGQAYYQMLWEGLQPKESAAEVRRLGAEALRYVRENDFKLWRPADECMLQYLLAEQDGRGDYCRVPVHTRKVFGWRP